MLRRFGAGLSVVLALSTFLTSPASASCAGLPPLPARLSGASVAFVGTVLATARQDRLALVRVETIWKGPALPPLIEVNGSPALPGSPLIFGGGSATSDDRRYKIGERYLFIPTSGPPFLESECSGTAPYSAVVATFSPAVARSPDRSGPAEAGALAERLRFAVAANSLSLPLLLVTIAILPLLALWWWQRE